MRTAADLGFLHADACSIERPVMRDPELQCQIEERGYVVVPFLDQAEVESLVTGYDRIAGEVGGANAPGDYNDTYAEFSVIHSRPEFRRRAYELITAVLVPVSDRLLVDHRPLIANFVNKPPGTGVVPAHQNFSVVDESEFRSVSVWVALVDCVLENGAMSMLDGSHRSLRGRRGMWAYQAFSGIEQDIIAGYLSPVEVPAGHAVILDDAVVHYSPPNRTDQRRLAIQFVMVPSEARPLWFQQVGATDDHLEVEVWEVEERFFFEFWHGDGDERFGQRTGRIQVPTSDLDVSTLRSLLGHPLDEVGEPAPDVVRLAPLEPSGSRAAGSQQEQRQRGLRARISRLSR